jgi:hypothetical protein
MKLFALVGNRTSYAAATTPEEARRSSHRGSVWAAGVKMKRYRLVPLRKTHLDYEGPHTLLIETETGRTMLRITRRLEHREAWTRQRHAVLRFRRLQRAWRIAKHFPFLRQRVLKALEA